MEVYALIGPSGTGKSHHAMEVAIEYDIDYIIDDGLLIHRGKKIAGTSAKAQPSMVAAVKCAIFLDPVKGEEMRKTLEEEKPKRLLILGTSEHMIDRIVQTLNLPGLRQTIFINDVLTPEEIEIALNMRKEGKHVIPLPAIEVRREFPNIWIDPLVGLFKRRSKRETDNKSIIRPKFSQLGQVTVSEQVVVQLVQHIAKSSNRIIGQCKTHVRLTTLGVLIQCETGILYGAPIQKEIEKFQEKIVIEIEYITGLTVRTVDVRVSEIYKEGGVACK